MEIKTRQQNDELNIKKKRINSLREYLENFYQKPIEKTGKIELEEYDWGEPAGREVW